MNMKSGPQIKPLFVKLLFAGLFPLLILLLFLIFDPFKIIRPHESYSYSPVVLNRDFVSTEYLLNNYQKYNYNSFILGNSQTLGFLTTDWVEHLPAEANPYHYDASGEVLYGLAAKVKLLDKKEINIQHAILLINEDILYETTEVGDGHIFQKHPAISQKPTLPFYLNFVKIFYQKFFFVKYLDHLFTGVYKPYMKGFLESRKVVYTAVHNDLILEDMEFVVSHSPDSFYSANQQLFNRRDTLNLDTADSFTHPSQVFLLTEIRNILRKHQSDYRIVIAPSYFGRISNPKNIQMLQTIFGKDRVYDFSGMNEFSRYKENYYDLVHFRPLVGKEIMKEIYATKPASYPVIQ